MPLQSSVKALSKMVVRRKMRKGQRRSRTAGRGAEDQDSNDDDNNDDDDDRAEATNAPLPAGVSCKSFAGIAKLDCTIGCGMAWSFNSITGMENLRARANPEWCATDKVHAHIYTRRHTYLHVCTNVHIHVSCRHQCLCPCPHLCFWASSTPLLQVPSTPAVISLYCCSCQMITEMFNSDTNRLGSLAAQAHFAAPLPES